MARPTRAIVVEGPDDMFAVRALLRRFDGGGDLKETSKNEWRAACADVDVVLLRAEGKGDLARRAAQSATAGTRPDRLAVCFDPDGDPPNKEFAFFEKAAGKELERDGNTLRLKIDKQRRVEVLPAAWRADDLERFDGLPDHHCLERVLISGLISWDRAQPTSVGRWAEDATKAIFDALPTHGWKRAFRIWNAALKPDAEAFVDGALQATVDHCLSVLRRTHAAHAIASLLVP